MSSLVKWRVLFTHLVLVVVSSTALFSVCFASTDPRDVAALNNLYVSLQSPPLTGWVPVGGDPCAAQWQGVSCVFSNVTALKLSGLNLGGMLSNDLSLLTSIIEIDVSNNHISGSIPVNLPQTLRNFSVASNQLNGSIPATLVSLAQLLDLQLNNNHLDGEVPDVFGLMSSLSLLDLSGNNLTGRLPPSMGNLTSITSMYLQNNKLIGILDVLQDLPLKDLNVENNIFSGPIPDKLFNIPDFRKDGNPFNTTILPSPPIALPPLEAPPPYASPPFPVEAPPPPKKQADAPSSASDTTKSKKSNGFFTPQNIIIISLVGAIVLVGLGLCFVLVPRFRHKQWKEEGIEKHGFVADGGRKQNAHNDTSLRLDNDVKQVPKESIVEFQDQQKVVNLKPQPPVIVPPNTSAMKGHSSSTPRVFTISTLQQYTESFSEENFVGEGTLGSVYKAELTDGTLLAVKKLNSTVSRQQTDDDFLQLVSSISKLRHPNVVELVGYCSEHGQRLLVYEYCECGTLHDALHIDNEIRQKLTWNKRIQLALGAARALEYLHEACLPPIIHKNFKSANILVDSNFCARVADCGLAPLKASGSTTELSARLLNAYGYGAPEFESGSYTCKSDVYSFGVVMLELLTGRQSYDRSLNLGEQSLVRWAIPQLHDIDALARMVDPSLRGTYSVKSLSRFADIISKCVQAEPEFRSSMSEVVQDLMQMI